MIYEKQKSFNMSINEYQENQFIYPQIKKQENLSIEELSNISENTKELIEKHKQEAIISGYTDISNNQTLEQIVTIFPYKIQPLNDKEKFHV